MRRFLCPFLMFPLLAIAAETEVPPVEGHATLDDTACGHEGTSGHVLPQLGSRVEGLELRSTAIAA